MDDKLLKKRLRGKVAMHMLFGLGGAVVIIGALFKILHLEIGPITGGLVLGLGLGTEALIFTVAALNTGEIKEEHDDYVKKIKGGPKKVASEGDPGLSSKIDEMLKEVRDFIITQVSVNFDVFCIYFLIVLIIIIRIVSL